MKVNEMSVIARHAMLPSYISMANFSERERQAALYTELSLSVSELFLEVQSDKSQVILDKFCNSVCRFLLVASSQNLLDKFLLDKIQFAQFKNKWASKSFNTVYLIMEQQILNAYFKHQMDDLIHAWHMLLKFGAVDLRFSEEEIEDRFFQLFSK